MRSLPGAVCCPGSSPDMGAKPSTQVLALLSSLLLGSGLGLAYDLLRPPRRAGGRGTGTVLDLLFALLAGAAAFLKAMGQAEGHLGLWELTAVGLGFLLYLYALSPLLLPLLERWYHMMFNTIRLFKKIEKNLGKTAKKIFPNLKEWIIMKR